MQISDVWISRCITTASSISPHRHNGETLYLGTFEVEKDAALAFDKAAVFYRGDKARLNFPDGELKVHRVAEDWVLDLDPR